MATRHTINCWISNARDVAVYAMAITLGFSSMAIAGLAVTKADVEVAVTQLEKKPESAGRKTTAEEELEAAGAANDEEIVAQAKALLDLLKESGQLDQASYNVIVSGSGAAAVGPGAVAAGKGGVAVGGNLEGGIRLGGSTDDEDSTQ